MAYKTNLGKGIRRLPLLLIAFAMMAGPSFAATYNLVAQESQATMPGGAVVPMWGFAVDTGSCPVSPPAWTVGPLLSVPAGEDLTINLDDTANTAVVSSNTFPSLPVIDADTLEFEMNVEGLVSSGGLGGPAILPKMADAAATAGLVKYISLPVCPIRPTKFLFVVATALSPFARMPI